MPTRRQRAWWNGPSFHYGFAISLSLAAAFLTKWISPLLGSTFFEFFHIAVVLSAFIGGLGPGILSATLSFLVIDYVFLPPANTWVLGPHLIRLVLFLVGAILVSWLSERLRQARRAIQLANSNLEQKIRQRTIELSQANGQLTEEIEQRREAEREILEVSSREQRRLGQDLHDTLCQTLAGLRLIVGELGQRTAPGPVLDDLQRIETSLGGALSEADAISRGLYPVVIETNGLMSALTELSTSAARMFNVACRFRCPNAVSISDIAAATHLFRIAQESVANAAKGGRASNILITLAERRGEIVMRVADDGVGFRNAAKRNGMGLRIMRHRVGMMNGRLNFRSGRKGRTIVRCAVPL